MNSTAKRVLVVDDELNIRLFLKTLLETSGYEPHLARNAREGLERAWELKPDLIILDVMMPGEGGLVMYQGLQEDPELRQVPVIMLSAVGATTFRHALKIMGIGKSTYPDPFAYVQKPPKVEEIKAIIDHALQMK
ncbi:MAG: response regulator [Pseudodesulfovibrio sp.]|uniref:Response regulator receiver n=1 Tax=Pseudodesulfovibrio aespoeensis (strain ATCC 700646 / DSM 10631 / Aspo-2) TaxID=643562 RepID=E6VW74_PSEA9|nr:MULTISPECIES: response regulator [Pseudodesulfovibrio]MBU4378656.1 response regulator [Pseudomonadota bacterium]MCG2740746.1 response regulator [Syntrophaceae bacterium]ADU63634.1 response regulator receiver [Pseudodesulfovibrio aespoeensis Aspo-2]MBU4475521.1 response regulator [Pseudomonadota bacterium]MBU4515377.1 response regulator [Pseudomonadota bacterium]